MTTQIRLTPIDANGKPRDHSGPHDQLVQDILAATVDHYRRVGFNEPWIGYLALQGDSPAGVCSFKSPPVEGRVEIAYFTFPPFEGQGVATMMAAQLVDIGMTNPDADIVAAQTLPARNASHRVLEKLKFDCLGEMEHPEDGTVLEWQLRKSAHPADSASTSKTAGR